MSEVDVRSGTWFAFGSGWAYHSVCMVATFVVAMVSAIASAFSRVGRMIRALTLIEAGATVRITSSASVN